MGISLAYQGSSENELIQVLQNCIDSIISLRQGESSQENTILYEWKSGNDDSVMELLCCCLVSLGLVCHVSVVSLPFPLGNTESSCD